MKTMFILLGSVSLFCAAALNGCSADDNVKTTGAGSSSISEDKNYKLLLDEDIFASAGLKKATVLENTIQYHLLMQECCPKSYLESQLTMFPLEMITNYYLSEFLPYDTTFLTDGNETAERSFRSEFKDIDFAEYDKERYAALAKDTTMMRMKRSDYWNAVFGINREYANPVGLADIEKAIRELHDRLGFDWNDDIYVPKNLLERHRLFIEDIFTNRRDEINKRYIKQ